MTSLSKEETMWKRAGDYAASVSDSGFLSHVKTMPTSAHFYDDAVECEKTAYDSLTTQLDFLVSRIGEHILSTHKEECAKQIQRDKHQEEVELETSRAEFVQKIADFCREHSRSYVAYTSRHE